jgi:prolyl-tRNA editing enzyme YbaK/EbsC (Cys-tRNA(Pro) deacylase)
MQLEVSNFISQKEAAAITGSLFSMIQPFGHHQQLPSDA